MKKQTRRAARRGAGLLASHAIAATIALSAALTLPATPSSAQAVKSCEDLGGTPVSSRPGACDLKLGFSPFEATFTGKFDTTMFEPKPSTVFKVTSKFDRPVSIFTAHAYVYDKAGKQLEFVHGDRKPKYWVNSKAGLLEIAPGQTKTFVFSLRKENLPPEMGALEIEFIAWTADNNKLNFARRIDTGKEDVRPKGGWK